MSYYNLFLDDVRVPLSLGTTLTWETVRSYKEFVNTIKSKGLPNMISFDHDLADEHYKIGQPSHFSEFDYSKAKEMTGMDCAKWLVEYCLNHKLPLPKWQVHSMNPCGKENITKLLQGFEKFRKEQNEDS